MTIYTAKNIFDGERFFTNQAIYVENGKIIKIAPMGEIQNPANVVNKEGEYLVPAFKDLQINGAGGIMFSANPSVEAIKAVYDFSIKGGATGFLITLPTNSMEIIKKSTDAIHEYWNLGYPGLMGFHIEGPYISHKKKGAHNPDLIKKPTLDEVKEIVEYGKGAVKMITLAPECCPDEVIEYLTKQGVVLFAGHSDATYNQALHGFELGIKGCTHLFNAMSAFTHHDAGLVGAAFDSDVYAGIIPDGVHTNETAIRTAHKIMGDRVFFVTDAITETKNEAYTYILKDDHYVTEKGTLAGSSLTMDLAVQKAVKMGISVEDALRKSSYIPAKVISEHHRIGKIAPGYEMDWAVLDKDLKTIEVISNFVK